MRGRWTAVGGARNKLTRAVVERRAAGIDHPAQQPGTHRHLAQRFDQPSSAAIAHARHVAVGIDQCALIAKSNDFPQHGVARLSLNRHQGSDRRRETGDGRRRTRRADH
jgi:hypothetical protein